jgi:hypothetical protein
MTKRTDTDRENARLYKLSKWSNEALEEARKNAKRRLADIEQLLAARRLKKG